MNRKRPLQRRDHIGQKNTREDAGRSLFSRAILSDGFALGMEARRAETAKLALFKTARPEGNVLRI